MARYALLILCIGILLFVYDCERHDAHKHEEEKPEETKQVETYKPGESYFGTALAIASQITDYYEKSVCLDIISDHLCNASDFNKAIEISKSIDDPYIKAQSLGQIAQYMLDKKMVDESVQLADEIRDLTLSLTDPMEKTTILTLCLIVYRETGASLKEKDVKNEIDKILESVKKKFPEEDNFPNPTGDIVSRIDSDIDDVRNYAHELEFIDALKAAKAINDKATRACAISYIGSVKAETHNEITDEEIAMLKELMTFPEQDESTKSKETETTELSGSAQFDQDSQSYKTSEESDS